MHRIPVESSDIVSIGYDESERILEIEFQNHRIYRYREVEPDIHAQLMRADSYGQFFSTFIVRRYRYQKVDENQSTRPDKMLPVAFVTGNPDKFVELQKATALFDLQAEQLVLPIDEIQSEDMEDVIVKKAKQAYKLAGRPVVVQDTFWNILALRGFPGAFMSYVTKWFRADDFLRLMEGKNDRDVVLTETVAYYDGKRTKLFSKEHRAVLSLEARGKGRLSIQEVIVLAGHEKTIAELRQAGEDVVAIEESVMHAFAKWLNMHYKTHL